MVRNGGALAIVAALAAPSAGATVRPYLYQGLVLTPLASFDAFPGLRHGVDATGAALPYQ